MENHEKEFLLKEYDTSWQQILSFDTRRGIFFNFFNFAFIAVLSLSSGVWVKSNEQTLFVTIILSLVYIMLLLVSYTVIKILESERKANVRYRKKINLIREMFLTKSDDEQVKYFLTRTDIGIKIDSGNNNEISTIGGTLKKIYLLIHIEQAVLILLTLGIWVAYFVSLQQCVIS
ncbi:hypothetical protein [Vibrio genomosp. F10]|uniref:hypothetical protein n=1 Tax=Vibrio genomosp. F10 TaxID=723171 RepID=UPI00037F5451|nr:hypothetical protein [Vibrio genomosp. F10]OEF07613.1 hypothetical protein A1QI_05000 [Vibrio genomosp. F10 str. 9ZB36]